VSSESEQREASSILEVDPEEIEEETDDPNSNKNKKSRYAKKKK
jgi:hypothetical protein